MPGVVSIPHGWGHRRSGVQLRVAGATPGESINDIIDPAAIDELSGTSALTGQLVEVAALSATRALPDQPVEIAARSTTSALAGESAGSRAADARPDLAVTGRPAEVAAP
jgi:hypothetical protein